MTTKLPDDEPSRSTPLVVDTAAVARALSALAAALASPVPAAPQHPQRAPLPPGSALNTTKAAAYLGVSRSALLHWVERGKIVPDVRGGRGVSKSHLFKLATLDAFLATGGRTQR